MLEPNVFSALSRYTNAPENTLTESFAFVLNLLLLHEKAAAVRVLNQLCDITFDIAQEIEVSTQFEAGAGCCIDIKICAQDVLVFIEVKLDAPLGERQLESYLALLQGEQQSKKRLVLLTRSRASEIKTTLEAERDFHPVRWDQVGRWLGQVDLHHPVCAYFTSAFVQFLKEMNMSIEQVSGEYKNGVLAMNRLMTMIEKAIPEAMPKVNHRSMGEDTWRGFYIGADLFFGIYYERPTMVQFADNHGGNNATYEKWLDLEKDNFFALTCDEQFRLIVEFAKDMYAKAPLDAR